VTALETNFKAISITKKRKQKSDDDVGIRYPAFKYTKVTDERIPLSRGVKLKDIQPLRKPPDSPESIALSDDDLVDQLAGEDEMQGLSPPSDVSKKLPESSKINHLEDSDDDIPIKQSPKISPQQREIIAKFEAYNKDYETAKNNLTDIFYVRFESQGKRSEMEQIYWEMSDFNDFVMETIDEPYNKFEKKNRKCLPPVKIRVNRYTELRDTYYDVFNELRKSMRDSFGNFNRNNRKTPKRQFNDIFRGIMGPVSSKQHSQQKAGSTSALIGTSSCRQQDKVRDKVPAPIVLKDTAPPEDDPMEIEDGQVPVMFTDEIRQDSSTEVGHYPLTDAAEFGHAPSTDAAEFGHAPSTDAAEVGHDPLTDAAEFGHAPSTDAAEFGHAPSTDAAEVGHDPSTDAVEVDHNPSTDAVEVDHNPSTDAAAVGHDPSEENNTGKSVVSSTPKLESSVDDDVNTYFNIEEVLIRDENTIKLTKRIESPHEAAAYTNDVDLPNIPIVGLPNYANNCYFNTVIQIFFRVKCIKALFMDKILEMQDQSKSKATCLNVLRNLFIEFVRGNSLMTNKQKAPFSNQIKVLVNAALQVLLSI